MARGNHTPRGGNRGGGRGGGRGRGRGGGFTPRGRGRGYGPMDEADFTIYDWAENSPRAAGSGYNSPNFRGRGRGSGYSTPRGGFTPSRGGSFTPRGGFGGPRGGYDSPRGRGRGSKPGYKTFDAIDPFGGMGRGSPPAKDRAPLRGKSGNWKSRMVAGVPLSKLLSEDRPLLRPIVFVRSVHNATLFQEQEDLLKPLSEDVANDEQSHMPTADRVTRVFGGDEEDEEEELEEIDFSEIGRLQAEVDAAAANGAKSAAEEVSVEQEFTGFYVDTNPSPVVFAPTPPEHQGPVLGVDDDDDDEIIVYVAPHPRAGPLTPPKSEAKLVSPSPPIVSAPPVEIVEEVASRTTSTLIAEESPTAVITAEETSTQVQTTDVITVEVVSTPEDSDVPVPTVSTDAVAPELPTLAPSSSDVQTSQPVAAEEQMDVTAGHSEEIETSGAAEQIAPHTVDEVTFTTLKATLAQRKFVRKVRPARIPRSLVKSRPRRKALKGFRQYGADLAEAYLQREDPKKSERRQGDSDLDWGDESNVGGEDIEELSTDMGAMDIDSDIDVKAMANFVKGMSAEGSSHVTMDDIADAERMKEEDREEEDEKNGSEEDGEEGDDDDGDKTIDADADADGKDNDTEGAEDVMAEEEKAIIAEAEAGVESSESDDDDDDSDEDEEETPRRNFQAQLQRMREKSKGKQRATAPAAASDEDDSDFDMELEQTWADGDEAFIAQIEALVDDNEKLLSRSERKARDKLFTSIANGDIDSDEYEEMLGRPATKAKDKYKDLPDEFQWQWEKDRAKKAENKRRRALERMIAASDPLVPKKGGKKGMKAALLAARQDADADLPNRIVDFVSLEQQIRRFIADIGGRDSMVLPPCDKSTRVRVHELANAFNLKSLSKGKGKTRYTTLTKTTKSGVGVNEKKVRRIMRQVAGDWTGPEWGGGGSRGGASLAKQKEGEEVGKAAPKIGESNVGYKLLASMGWAEGERIGLSGGIDAPLTAIFKKTKLGLGATS